MAQNDLVENVTLDDIGPGYRNVAYKSGKEGSKIILYGYDKKNNPKTFVIPHTSHAHYEVKFKTARESIFGTSIATKCFNSSYERYKWLDSLSDSIRVFEAYRPETEFLHGQFGDLFLDEDFNTQPLRTHFIDIEVAIQSEFCHPTEAAYPINLITIYDTYHKRYYSWVLGTVKNTFTDKEVIIFKFEKEEDLLHNFVKWFKANYPDVISGWNIRNFDMPYIIRRLENVLGIKVAEEISPVRKYRSREGFDAKGKATFTYTIDGLSQLDLLPLYRDKFQVALSLDGGYNLDNVAEHELNERKIQYEGTLRDFYIRDFQKFFEYNVRDVELTVKIEEKRQLIPLARRITSFGLCQLETIYSSIPYLIGSLSLFTRKHMYGKIFPSYSQIEHDRGDFEGAYVFPTQMGFYQYGVGCIDLNSLYPNTIISLNCSPETKVGQVFYNDDESITIRSKDKSKTVTKDVFEKILNEKCILSKNNTLFFKHSYKEGALPKWSEYFYNSRKKYQAQMKSLKRKAISTDITDDEKIQLETHIKNYNTIQIGIKNMLNSVYGILGTPYCPFYDTDLAQSITLNGQFVNKSVAKFIMDSFKGQYSSSEDLKTIISGDTDSLFLNLEPFTKKYAEKFNIEPNLLKFTRTQFKELSKEIDDFVENKVNDFVKNLVNSECHTTKGHHIRYGREYIASEGMFFRKKHYLVHIIDDEGNKVDKFKYSGIAVKKTALPSEMKPLLKHIYEHTCIDRWTFTEYRSYLNEIFDKFKQYPFETIALNQSYNTEKQVTGYLTSEKGTQAAVRGAHYYNHMLKEFNLEHQYDQIMLGDVIHYAYIYNNNPYNIDVIAYKNKLPDIFKDVFKINYELMFEKLFVDTLKGYVEAMNFSKYQPANQMETDIFTL